MKHKIFEDFKLRKINKKDLNQILALRNKYKIRKSMINNKRISQTEHLNWFINLSKSIFFIIMLLLIEIK